MFIVHVPLIALIKVSAAQTHGQTFILPLRVIVRRVKNDRKVTTE